MPTAGVRSRESLDGSAAVAAAARPRPRVPRPEPQPHAAARPRLPRISIVTPSFNQGRFLEETIRSVLEQNYPDLEYVVMDGGSTDESANIIRRYERRLASWTSAPDAGQFDAINRGFARTSGEVMAWLNSDDKYTPWALGVVGEIFAQFPQVQWLTSLFHLHWDGDGLAVRCKQTNGYSRRGFYRGHNLPRPGVPRALASHFVQQESTFWRRSLWEKAGGTIDTSLSLAGDAELWARFFRHAELYAVATPLGGFRMHDGQKTRRHLQAYVQEALSALARHGGRPYGPCEAAVRSTVDFVVPARVRRWIGLSDAAKVIVCSGDEWTIESRS